MWKELEGKTIGIFDTETNGLLHNVSKVHCCVISVTRDPKTRDTMEYCLGAQKLYLAELDKLEVLAGHNIIGFDLPLLKQMFGWSPRPEVIILDTLWMSRMYHPDIDGGHSLGAWGARLGNSKVEYYPVLDAAQDCYDPDANIKLDKGWERSHYTEAMGAYCVQDVNVNVDVFWKLVSLLKNFSWKSIKCEMDTAAIIQRQMQHGFVFDVKGGEILHAKLVERIIELEDEVLKTFKPIAKFVRDVQPKIRLSDLTVSSVGLSQITDWEKVIPLPQSTTEEVTKTLSKTCDKEDFGARYDNDDGVWYQTYTKTQKVTTYHSGSFSLIEFPEFSLGSRQQIGERLTRAGYKLTKVTDKGNYIIDDVVLQEAADAGIPEAVPLAEYFLVQKREAMVKAWIEASVWHEDQGVHRIHGYVNSMGANTNRMTHSSPNVAQVPAGGKPYGKECRSLFGVRKGYKLVGCDASGLELRTLAHYMGDRTYIQTLLEGDIHWVNCIAVGFVPEGTIRDKGSKIHDGLRDNVKTFIYAFLYGAGDAKIGAIVGGKAKDGKILKANFLEKTPALKKLREGVLHAAKERGWLKGFDGRILRVRSPHSALNTLLQGMGAIVMKYWLIEVAKNADAEGLDWNPSANIHDEGQFEVADKDVERFSEICVAAFPKISQDLGSLCLLEGEVKIGLNWAETH
jgi:DNA polymerase-1